jgi:hypothetical protein
VGSRIDPASSICLLCSKYWQFQHFISLLKNVMRGAGILNHLRFDFSPCKELTFACERSSIVVLIF